MLERRPCQGQGEASSRRRCRKAAAKPLSRVQCEADGEADGGNSCNSWTSKGSLLARSRGAGGCMAKAVYRWVGLDRKKYGHTGICHGARGKNHRNASVRHTPHLFDPESTPVPHKPTESIDAPEPINLGWLPRHRCHNRLRQQPRYATRRHPSTLHVNYAWDRRRVQNANQ